MGWSFEYILIYFELEALYIELNCTRFVAFVDATIEEQSSVRADYLVV